MPSSSWTRRISNRISSAVAHRGSTAARPAAVCVARRRARGRAPRAAAARPRARRVAVAQGAEAHRAERAVEADFEFRTRELSQLQPESDVLRHRLVRPHRIILEDQRDAATRRRNDTLRARQQLAPGTDLASARRVEACQQLQRRRHAAPGRTEKREQRAVRYVQIDRVKSLVGPATTRRAAGY